MRSPSYSFIRHYYKINSMSSNILYLIETQTKDKEIRVDFTPQKKVISPREMVAQSRIVGHLWMKSTQLK